jgi:hypothetical protein
MHIVKSCLNYLSFWKKSWPTNSNQEKDAGHPKSKPEPVRGSGYEPIHSVSSWMKTG